ncbi:alpha/beta fold hydrolase [Arthrobacter sp. 260]|uniref:alpha/beta hydrolase family protein n=1 Tax=Arthrobacter sp. 260 TaxID=2735314 RepID=UPI001E317AE3|nr:alpha/beta fold hydrolase [Arthrobacter sp. 260]
MKRLLAAGAVLLTACGLGLGWGIARRLTASAGLRKFDLVVRDVERDGDGCLIVLDRTRQTVADGIYNLWFQNGGWVQLSAEVLDRGRGRIERPVTSASAGFALAAGDRTSWSGIYFASPTDAGLSAREVAVDTAVGSAPAWLVEGESDRSTWAIHVHGLGSTRAGTLRGVRVASDLGYTSLIITYRNDGEGPKAGSGRSSLGFTEVEDAEAAVHYAIQHGAHRIILFGWSMGAAIALQLVDRARYHGIIVGVVLESPVLDWVAVINANCIRSGLPAASGILAIPWLTLPSLSRMTGLPTAIPLRDLDWVARAAELAVPMLIIHGTLDDSAPIRVSQAVRDLRPDLVEFEAFTAGHTLSWNSDPERWQSTVTAWLLAHVNADAR